ncbi:flagellar basal body P-ring formation protein FlgA [Shewanella sp. 202IG2-18]|uniref:flagellar basal body P-ring formation chaperone FlgA n=1 Tax=Parashewanella hymeniacidonis TaxID=2807618 RepID=UPI001961267F|nr:flagellar basal body P-ring formation chaperone FlgA [Parashewanella hymeniacidonis]MBM7073061.1 flagellar basal body P-ring formation protein FlgA [Parashewanella hymeniacidonis]
MKVSFFLFIAMMVTAPSTYSKVNPYVPTLQDISNAAQGAVKDKIVPAKNAKITITPQNINERFKRPQCISPISASLVTPKLKRNNTVKLSCKTNNAYPWQVYLSVVVKTQYQVAVPTKTLASNELIDASKVTLKYLDENSIRGTHFDSLKTIIGTKTKKRIAKNHPIFSQNICFVCKGDTVKIFASTKSFSIRTTGTAKTDGNLHDTIEILNNHSNKTIKAQVIGIGEVQVKM